MCTVWPYAKGLYSVGGCNVRQEPIVLLKKIKNKKIKHLSSLWTEIAQGEFCREDQVCVAGATCQGANDSSTGQCTCVRGVSKRNGEICGKSHAVRSVPGSMLGLSKDRIPNVCVAVL